MRLPLIALTALALPLTARADALLAQIMEKRYDAPVTAFTSSFTWNETEVEALIDPTRGDGERMTILSPAKADWPEGFADYVERMDASARGEIWCSDFLANVPADAERAARNGSSVTYTFTPLPDADAENEEKKLFRKLVGTLVVDSETEVIESYQMHLPAPMKPHFMARITTFDMFVRCAPAGNGNSYSDYFTFDLSGSALGNDFAQSEERRVSELREPFGTTRTASAD